MRSLFHGRTGMFATAASVLLLVACNGQGSAQQSSDAFVRWATSHAAPIRTEEAGGDEADLRPLEKMARAARVVALGEPAHGAHEPLALRNRLFEFLVERMGFTAIAIESGLSESQRVQKFVLGGRGTARDVVRHGLTWGFGELDENVALVQWMHDYNANPAHSRKIRFYGIDLSSGGDAAFGRARVTIDAALSFLERADTASANGMRAKLEPYLDRFSSPGYPKLAPMDRDRVSAAIDGIISMLERERATLVTNSSEADYEWALRNAESARQLDAFFRVEPPPTADGSMPPTLYRAMNVRDSSMAANLEWVLAREGAQGRVMLYAHDAHVMRSALIGPLWKSFARPATSMGVHLGQELGPSLFIIATSSANNAPGLPQATLDSSSVDAALARVGPPLFLLKLRSAEQSAGATSWLAERHRFRINFDTYIEVVPDSAFDALMFVNSLTRSGASP